MIVIFVINGNYVNYDKKVIMDKVIVSFWFCWCLFIGIFGVLFFFNCYIVKYEFKIIIK